MSRSAAMRAAAPALRCCVMLAGLAGLAGLGFACVGGRGAPVAAVADGVAIALYARAGGDGYGVIDDRRWVEVAGDQLVVDRVDPGAALPSFVIEAIAGGALEVGACRRDRLATVLQCAVRARPGRYLIRLLYVSTALRYRTQHDIAMTAADRATIASRFAIATPALDTRAELTLYDGVPGSEPPPRQIARGTIALDGGTAQLAVAPRSVGARLRRIYDGAARRGDGSGSRVPRRYEGPNDYNDGPDPRDPRWGRDSQPTVWVWLELADVGDTGGGILAPGPVSVHIAAPGEPARDVEVPAVARRRSGNELRLALWPDLVLVGKRDRSTEVPDDGLISDRFQIAITNRGDTAREVWIEETLRPGRRHTLGHAWPRSPELGRHHLRLRLLVAPGAVERAGFAIDTER